MTKFPSIPILFLGLGSIAAAQEPPPPPAIDPGPPPDFEPASPAPQVTAPFNERLPESGRLAEGQRLELRVISSLSPETTFQWYKDGLPLPGRTGPALSMAEVSAADAGAYQVATTLDGNTTLADQRHFSVFPPSRFANLSTRGESRNGDGVLIPGFVIGGNGTKELLIRAVGPRLVDFGVTGELADPTIALKKLVSGAFTDFAANNDWGSNANASDIIATSGSVGAFTLESGSKDAALLLDLEPGQYTVVTSGVDNGTGVALLELYDSASDAEGAGTELVNISTRGFVGTGDSVLIPGVVITGDAPLRVLVRAVGPSLAGFGVSNVLPDPQFTLFRDSDPVGGNNDWIEFNDQEELAEQTEVTGAFALQPASRDAAAIFTLEPGAYTVVVSDVGGSTGQALVELYRLAN